MATIGVLTYTLPPGLKLKNGFEKLPISSSNLLGLNNQNSIVTKIENIGMIGGEVVVVRKKQMPLTESNIGNIQHVQAQNQLQEPPTKRLKLSTGETPIIAGKKSSPQPQAVARRNARERRRVKQVNDGFTALRQHIPEEVAVAFEAAGNGRGTSKKLSKVETLRMAVEYIRSLERLLEIDSNDATNSDLLSNTVIKTESCTPPLVVSDGQCSESSYDPSADESATIYYADTLPDITTLNGQQYLRIPGTNTYQLITADVFENEENIQPPMDITCSGYARAEVTDQHTTIATASTIIAPAPISSPPSSHDFNDSGVPPQSISPASSILDHHQAQQQQHQRLHDHLLPQVRIHMQEVGGEPCGVRIKCEDHSLNIYQSHLAPSSSPITDVDAHGYIDQQLYESGGGLVTFKREIKEEGGDMVVLDTTGTGLSEESMMDAIDWWHDHNSQSDDSAILS
ncbi:unnamed protein product [Hermetia illucens]|uniref:BHLH domain-containing protein n=1 Tax=Hermetia illucens TaxID=343691 RepID=A0A7R8YZJ7_HERIL|nr:achaete-scute complex protein T8 [Hermetia illucens]CAD7091339.1 unnamed protein product [Hermetia illucens]